MRTRALTRAHAHAAGRHAAAGPRCYFGFGSWSTVYQQLSQRWPWLFDFPLGPPLGDAIMHEESNTYHRQFAHVNVSEL
jgi:hypothetical protein